MMIKRLPLILFAVLPLLSFGQKVESFNTSWEFVKDVDTVFIAKLLQNDFSVAWEKVTLPHTASLEPIHKNAQQWQGTCYYKKYFSVPLSDNGKHIAIQFDAAMQVADVYLNGKQIYQHKGGYLPFYINISENVLFDRENSLLVKLNNEDNSLVPPGKPIKDLDFNYYSGLYRNVWLITKEKLYISNAVAVNKPAGGGVLVHTDQVTNASARLSVKVEINNDLKSNGDAQVRIAFTDNTGNPVTQTVSEPKSIAAMSSDEFTQVLTIPNPKLWSPETPYLYNLSVELLRNGQIIDRELIKTGIRTIRISKEGLYLNDNRVVIRGTNRHQDYPYIGNALSDNAQYRDAYKIKMAGFNFVRTSHYPQAPSFLDACDELGILVMDAIPGWQFAGNDVFQKNSLQDIRDMIHRDRNHPSIIMWEASLNESGMKKDYMQKAHTIVHEELPFQGIYSAGWINDVYDVFLPARQHAKAPEYWKKYDKERPLLIAEYGDWEYYAQNAGFNQAAYKDLKVEERTSRQLRGFGEKRLMQQAINFQEAHNDNLVNPGLGDANWLMFDYNRGYADDIESSGIMDMVRLPKFSFYFYQSQADPVLSGATLFNKPMLFIANYWQGNGNSIVKIYSNCDEVELFANGKSIGKQQPDKDAYSINLKHAPFSFKVSSYRPGKLIAFGYIHGRKVIERQQQTPEAPIQITVRADESGRTLQAGKNDLVFVYAEIRDVNGTIIPDFSGLIEFKVEGDAKIIGVNPLKAEAGIAAILLQAGAHPGRIRILAEGKDLQRGETKVEAK